MITRNWIAACAIALLLSAPLQAQDSPWSLNVETDKLTDQKILIATVDARVADARSPLYQMELRCDGKTRRVTIAAFNADGSAREIQIVIKMIAVAHRCSLSAFNRARLD